MTFGKMSLSQRIKRCREFSAPYRITDGSKFKLKDIDPSDTGDLEAENKPQAKEVLVLGVETLAELQARLYAQDQWAVLALFQAMDAAGKDGTIKHVMSGVNPQGCQVYAFKQPTSEDLDHDYFWRCLRRMPERGRIGIFNRSYYEEVLAVKVHKEFLASQKIPPSLVGKSVWEDRYEDICNVERYLTRNGIVICKFFLHLSKKEQKRRFLERLDTADKNWKFSAADAKERGLWGKYQGAYEEMIRATATEYAPWYVVPADNKWFSRLVVAAAIIEALGSLDLEFPKVDDAKKAELAAAREALETAMSTGLGRFVPGLAALLGYNRHDLRPDIVAGLSVAAVALPVGIAYAEIARVPAVVGIYLAIFPLFAYALFGSSRQLMTGPDAATCLMAAVAISTIAGGDPQRYMALMVALTLMTGLFYLVAGVARLGFIANFLSQPILVGYLNGIALIILFGQLPKLCGFAIKGDGFFPQVAEVVERLDATHPPTLILGAGLLVLLVALQRLTPRLPGALIVAIVGIVAATALGLAERGVAVLGSVPAGFPQLRLPSFNLADFKDLVRDAAGIMLISFTSGVLTAKSFAQRNRYDIDANQELVGFGACNLASGLAQGFPVTGADSRTAVNNATGGRTQLVGIIAGATMLVFLSFLIAPLAHLPTTALAAIIIVSAFGLFDFAALRRLWGASGRELAFSLATTAGVLFFGVLPGVLLAVVLSLLWLLSVGSRPHEAILGRAPGIKGFHNINDYPEAATIPGLLIYRFDANLVFFNCDHFKESVLRHIDAAAAPVEWVLIDASPINVIDYTALQKVDELREELRARGIALAYARAKQSLHRFFRPGWATEREKADGRLVFPTVKSAIDAFERRNRQPNLVSEAEKS